MFSSSIKYMYVQENTRESLRLEKWRRTDRQEKPLERSRNVRENSAEQARGKKKDRRRENDGLEQAAVGF